MDINKIKEGARVVIHLMENHTIKNFPNEDFKDVIEKMHNASTKDELAKAYSSYINLCLGHNYKETYILAGIMQNEDKNKEFNVNLDNVLKSIINIKSNIVELGVLEKETKTSETCDTTSSLKDLNKDEIIALAAEYDPNAKTNALGSTNGDIMRGDLLGVNNAKRKAAYELISKNITDSSEKTDNKKPVKEPKKEDTVKEQNTEKSGEVLTPEINSVEHNPVQQTAAANTMGAGFNINNFIKPVQPAVQNTAPAADDTQAKPAIFSHQIDNVTKEQMIEVVKKHYVTDENNKIYTGVDISALYDLIKHKKFAKKLKQLNCQYKIDELKLTPVSMASFVNDNDGRYTMAFTTECKDKGFYIAVLFNPVPEMTPNGYPQYPINVLKKEFTKKK